jgi:mono/diheme cytochrome c family protein
MKKPMKAVLVVIGIVVLAAGALLGWILLTWDRAYDDVPIPQLEASTDPTVIERGHYLVRGPAHCSNCHAGSLEEAMRADAGEELPMKGGLPIRIGPIGVLYSANLTPDRETGIGRYTDGQLFRLLRHNVKPNGQASLAPLMPFANMADNDLIAVVSYLRALPPARWTLFGKAIVALVRPAAFQPVLGQSPPASAPEQAATVERGEYIAKSVANCMACHSPLDPTTGELTGPAFSGNATGEPSLTDPTIILRMPNLTPDPTGVLVRYPTEEAWIKRFRAGRVIRGSFMHWGPFSRMGDDDLRAIYMYLHTLKPVANDVGPVAERVGR